VGEKGTEIAPIHYGLSPLNRFSVKIIK